MRGQKKKAGSNLAHNDESWRVQAVVQQHGRPGEKGSCDSLAQAHCGHSAHMPAPFKE